MADEKPNVPTIKTFKQAVAENDESIRKWRENLPNFGKLADEYAETIKWAESLAKGNEAINAWVQNFTKQNNTMTAALSALGLGKQVTEWATSLKELIRLTEEGKLGEYSDETPLPELMERMKRLKEAQQKALETGQVDLAAANEWLINRWPEHRSCPLCNHEEWRIGPSFAQIPTSTLGLQTPPRINPCVAVVCGHCGNTILLNALIMGLLPEEK
jgi:hypothetical protein